MTDDRDKQLERGAQSGALHQAIVRVTSPWYLSASATREYLNIAGLVDDDGGPNWVQAERELALHAASAREVQRTGDRVLYRTGRVKVGDRERTTRLEFTVSFAKQPQGPLPQLLRVRDKGRTSRASEDRAHHRGIWKQQNQ